MGRTGRAPGPRPPIQLVVGLFARPGWREAALGQSSLLLPVEHQLQVLSDARSPAALQLLGYASAAQRAAGVSRLVPHALLRLLQREDHLALGEGDPHPSPDRVRLFARERENVRQEGFDGSIGFSPAVPPVSLADSPSPSKAPRRAREGRW
jgi:hypothetical protein